MQWTVDDDQTASWGSGMSCGGGALHSLLSPPPLHTSHRLVQSCVISACLVLHSTPGSQHCPEQASLYPADANLTSVQSLFTAYSRHNSNHSDGENTARSHQLSMFYCSYSGYCAVWENSCWTNDWHACCDPEWLSTVPVASRTWTSMPAGRLPTTKDQTFTSIDIFPVSPRKNPGWI